jgi:hypothetical protein
MLDRRQFIASIPTAAAAGGLLPQAQGLALPPPQAVSRQPSLALSLNPLRASGRARLRAALPPALAESLHWTWREIPGSAWAGDNLQQHWRYLADPQARPLDSCGDWVCSAAQSQGMDPAGTPRALLLGLQPQALVLHRGKAAAQGIGEASLAGFAARGRRPRFPVNSAGSAPENAWLLPFFARAVDLRSLPLQALGALVENGFSRLDLQLEHGPLEASYFDPLLDPEHPLAALYGPPALLKQALATRSAALRSQLQILPLQDFLQSDAPSWFAASMLQIGPAAPELAGMPALPQRLAPWLAAELPAADASSSAWHAPQHYDHLPRSLLLQLCDGGGLARLAIDIDAGLRWGGRGQSGMALAHHAVQRTRALA